MVYSMRAGFIREIILVNLETFGTPLDVCVEFSAATLYGAQLLQMCPGNVLEMS